MNNAYDLHDCAVSLFVRVQYSGGVRELDLTCPESAIQAAAHARLYLDVHGRLAPPKNGHSRKLNNT